MQNINLELEHHDFFCPVTGQHIIGEYDEFKPSPAMVYCYVDEGEAFEYTQDWVKEIYEKCLQETKDDSLEAYNKLIKKMDPDKTHNLICFNIGNSSPLANIGYARFCIDMDYMKNKDN